MSRLALGLAHILMLDNHVQLLEYSNTSPSPSSPSKQPEKILKDLEKKIQHF